MIGWHHQLNGHEFEQAPRDSEGQGSLACCSPWGRKESDTTERLNKNYLKEIVKIKTTWQEDALHSILSIGGERKLTCQQKGVQASQ